jgi:hypothetical protein
VILGAQANARGVNLPPASEDEVPYERRGLKEGGAQQLRANLTCGRIAHRLAFRADAARGLKLRLHSRPNRSGDFVNFWARLGEIVALSTRPWIETSLWVGTAASSVSRSSGVD